MIAWVCGECSQKNPASVDGRFCRACGSPRNASVAEPRREREPEFVAPWNRPGFKPSKPEDPCDEPGCTKTVRDHIEEFRAIVNKPETVFSRPSVREVAKVDVDEAKLDERRMLLAQQAAQLRRQA